MDWLTLLRLGGLFGTTGGGNPGMEGPTIATNMPGSPIVLNAQSAQAPTPPPPPDNTMPPVYPGVQPPVEKDPFERIMELYNAPQSSPANDALMEMYQNFPERNKPGALRQVLGALSALGSGGPAMTDAVLYAPYYRQLQDYTARMKPLEVAARAEDRDADNRRMMLLGLMQRYVQGQRAETYDELSRARIEKLNADILKMQADAARKQKEYELRKWIAEHPNHKYFWDSDGKLHAVNPQDNKEYVIEGVQGLTEQEKQDMIQERQVAVEEERGANAKERSEIGKWTIVNIGNASYRLNTATGEMIKISDTIVTKPGTPGAGRTTGPRPMTKLEQLRQRQLNAQIILDKNPEFRNKVIRFDEMKQPYIVPGVLSREEEIILQRRLLNDVYDEDGNPLTHQNLGNRPLEQGSVVPADSNKPQSPNVTNATKVPPEGWILVRRTKDSADGSKKKGQQFRIPMSRLKDYLNSGEYEKVVP